MTSKEIAAKYGCGDGGCPFGRRYGGQHTNGGCRCLGLTMTPNERVKVRAGIVELSKSLKELERLLEVDEEEDDV